MTDVTTLGVWLGVAACLSQSAMFSGLNIAVFSMSRLRLEIESAAGNTAADRVLALREDSSATLTTILWGNVGVNVLLTLLTDSVLTGVSAFAFSTIFITLFGEIAPQAYFSRNAMRVASVLAPVLQAYKLLLYPVARPSAALLDAWLGTERLQFYREHELRELIRLHVAADEAEIERLEGIGALNFLAMDDLAVTQEGEDLDPRSIIALPAEHGRPVFPDIRRAPDDPFLQRIEQSGRKWVIVTDLQGEPLTAIDSDEFLRAALFGDGAFDPGRFEHHTIIVRDPRMLLGKVVAQLQLAPTVGGRSREREVILVWGEDPRIITVTDILDRLLRGATPPAGDGRPR